MGIIGRSRRSLFGPPKVRVAKTQEGSPSRSGGAAKDHKKRRFPSSLFKRGRQSAASTLVDSQGASAESHHSPAVSDEPVDDDNTDDCLFDSLEESILAVDPAYLDSSGTGAGSDATGKISSPDLLQQGNTNAASDPPSFDVNNASNNVEPYEQSHHSGSQEDTATSEQAQGVLTAHHGDAHTGSHDIASPDDEITSESRNSTDLQAPFHQRENNGTVLHYSSSSRSLHPTPPLSAPNSARISRLPSSPSPTSSNHLIGTPDANDTLAPNMESSIGVELTSSQHVDTALSLHRDHLMETLRMDLDVTRKRKDALEAEIRSKDVRIWDLEAQNQQLDLENEGTYQDYLNLHVFHDRVSRRLTTEKGLVQQLQNEVALRNTFISNLSNQVQVSQQQKSKKETELKELQTKVGVLQGQDTAQKEQSEAMQENLDRCRDALRTKDERITELEAKVGQLVAGSTAKDENINELHRQRASVVEENALIREQAKKLVGDAEQNLRLRAENTQLRQRNADLETTNGYHQRYINELTDQRAHLNTRVGGQQGTIATLLRMDGRRQYEIKDLYHGYACLCVKARSEPISKDVFKATSHARYDEDHPLNGPCQNSSAPAILSPRPVRPNPAWVSNEFLQQLDLD